RKPHQPDASARDQFDSEFRQLMEEYDRGGLPYERALMRLSFARWLTSQGDNQSAAKALQTALDLARRHDMKIIAADALEMLAEVDLVACAGKGEAETLRQATGYFAPCRP